MLPRHRTQRPKVYAELLHARDAGRHDRRLDNIAREKYGSREASQRTGHRTLRADGWCKQAKLIQ